MSDPPLPRRSNSMVRARPEGGWELRLFHRKARGKVGPRYLVKCGCCDERLEIYYGDGLLEINGVLGSVENWREILLPLLECEGTSGEGEQGSGPRDGSPGQASLTRPPRPDRSARDSARDC